MDTYEDIYKSVCRVCLSCETNVEMVSLIDNNSEDGLSCYGKAVLTFSNIEIQTDDCLPTKMCHNCLLLLKQAIYFKLNCESSYKRLKFLFEKFTDRGLSEQNIAENIVQYLMYTRYLPHNTTEGTLESEMISKELKTQEFNSKIYYVFENESLSDNMEEQTYLNPRTLENINFNQNTQLDADSMLEKLEKMFSTNINMSSINSKKRVKKCLKRAKNLNHRHTPIVQIEEDKTEELLCNICHKMLANQNTYEHHMQRHNGCRYICEHCGKGFPVLAELQLHKVSQHGTGPYLLCQHCDFKAGRKFDLIEHLRIHTGERPFACEKCGLTFRRRGIWKKHLIYHLEKKVQCPQCPRKFYQRSEMLAHANNVHERLYVYLCNKCGATYAKTSTVRRHLTERHGIPRDMQGKVIRINKGKDMNFPEQ